MAKKAKKAASQPTIMDQLSSYQPAWNEKPEGEEDKNAGGADTGLVERIAKMEAELDAARRQQAYQGFTASPQASPAERKAPVEVKFDDLPDPISDTKAYTAELVKRINAANDAKLEAQRSEFAAKQEQSQLANQVWEGFKKAQPEWAKHDMLVQAAATRVSQDMQGRGVDMVKLLRQQPDLFYGEVAGLLNKQYPSLKGGEEDDGDDEGTEENRTTGVFGGTPGRQKSEGPAPEEGSSMLKDLAEIRYKAGVR